MARRDPAHQPRDRKGELVRYGSREIKRTLLPFEAELCDLLGVSEDEYFAFVDACAERAGYRPAAYDLIPDVQAGPALVPILIQLAIGIAFTAISALLAPKPDEPEQIKQRTRANRTGADRFSPRYGFDSIADLASLGEPVPIVWTFYTGYSGGVVFEPKLVWSKAYSWGTQQSLKLLYVLGEGAEGQPAAPDRAGIWLGNNGLNVLQDRNFAFWYSTSGKPGASPLLGTANASRASGDPSPGYQGDKFPNFSQSYTPSNNSVFGVSNPIANGTHYRVQWRTVSVPAALDDDGKQRGIEERLKICGFKGAGMPGVGVGYPRRLGQISSGEFLISGRWLKRNIFDEEVGVDDINSALDNECIAADDVMQIGEYFISGGTVYQVTGRSREGVWLPPTMDDGGTRSEATSPDMVVYITPVETVWSGVGNGILNRDKVAGRYPISRNAQRWDFTDRSTNARGVGQDNIGGGHYPFCMFTSAEVKNSRPCDVTELGIRSTVWGRFNGTTNFNTIPSPKRLQKLDEENVTVQTGTMNLYFKRTSLFTVWVRPAGSSSWSQSGRMFAVRGATPQEQYNVLRFVHAQRAEYEFRLVPLTGTVALEMMQSNPGAYVHILNAAADTTPESYGIAVSMPYGITLYAYGTTEAVSSIVTERLTWSDPFKNDNTRYLPDSARFVQVLGNKSTAVKQAAILYELMGGKKPSSGQTEGVVVSVTGKKNNGKPFQAAVFFTCTAVWAPVEKEWRWGPPDNVSIWDQYTAAGELKVDIENGEIDPRWNPAWGTQSGMVSDASASWPSTEGKRMKVFVDISPENPYFDSASPDDGYRVGLLFTVWSARRQQPLQTGLRKFEWYTSVNEVSHYGSSITRSCESSPEHAITYVNEIRDNSATFTSLAMCGVSVKSNRSFSSADQLRLYLRSGITASNSFPRLIQYMLGKAGSGLAGGMIDTASFDTADSFCASNKLFFDGVLAERTNLRSFITSMAPFFLLNLVIANGKLALKSALPTASVALFTEGNIVDGSLRVEKIDTGERRPFRAVMIWRSNPLNQLPRTRTVTAYWNDRSNSPMEQYDMSAFCTQESHATLAARYLLAIRRYVTKTVSFKTTPDQARVQPGELITLAVEQVAITRQATGVVRATGEVVSTVPMSDGTYDAVFYKSGDDHPMDVKLTVQGGSVVAPYHWGGLFALKVNTVTSNPYIVEQVQLDEDGLVDITASEFPPSIRDAVFSGSGISVERE